MSVRLSVCLYFDSLTNMQNQITPLLHQTYVNQRSEGAEEAVLFLNLHTHARPLQATHV